MRKKVRELPEGAIVVGIVNNKEVFGKVEKGKLTDFSTKKVFSSETVVFT